MTVGVLKEYYITMPIHTWVGRTVWSVHCLDGSVFRTLQPCLIQVDLTAPNH